MNLNVRVELSELEDEFVEIGERVTDLREAWPAVDRFTSRMYRKQFASEGSYLGTPWKPLKPKTLKARNRPGGNRGGILRDTNRLWASLTKPRAPEGITRFGRTEYQRGTTVPYARFHQQGTKHLPERPLHPDPLPLKIRETFAAMIRRHLET